jgi:hypothetical protein
MTEAEQNVYEELRGMQLEQERLPYGWIANALSAG